MSKAKPEVEFDQWGRPIEKCRVCKRPVLVMCQKGTGICSQICEQKEKEE